MYQPENKFHSPEAGDRNIPLLERYRAPVDLYMRDLLSATPGDPARMIEYHVGFRDQHDLLVPTGSSDGKAIRPTFSLLTVDAIGGDWQRAVPAAAALELFHQFTLIHDDIQDGDEERHGKPTVWKKWGKEQAINAGNAAHILSTQSLLGLSKNDYSVEKTLAGVDLLTQTGLKLAEGQSQDMAFEGRLDVTPEEYLAMIAGKTGVLLESSIAMGALLGGADEETTSHLREYGQASGLAFQIVDDGLGIWGDPAKTGKPVGADILKRKKAYPVVLAFDQAEGATKRQLETIYGQSEGMSEADKETVLGILHELGCKEQAKILATAAVGRAIDSIMNANIDLSLKGDYLNLAEKFVSRQR